MSSTPEDTKLEEAPNNAPRPMYYLHRNQDTVTPLIPLDELPEWLSITGLTRYIKTDDLKGQSTLPEQLQSKQRYGIEIAMIYLEAAMAKKAAENQGGMPTMVPSNASVYVSVETTTLYATDILTRNVSKVLSVTSRYLEPRGRTRHLFVGIPAPHKLTTPPLLVCLVKRYTALTGYVQASVTSPSRAACSCM